MTMTGTVAGEIEASHSWGKRLGPPRQHTDMAVPDLGDADLPEGPAYRCRNGSCDLIKPRTTVHESERKTTYRCPGCSRSLGVNWHE